MNNVNFILGDIQKIISLKLQKNNSRPLINELLLYDIVFFIEEKLSFKHNNDLKSGVIAYVDDFKKRFNLSKEVIKRHIDWLINCGILWQSKLSFNTENNKRLPRRYDINWNIKITNYQRFVYTTYKDYSKLKDITPVLHNVTTSNVYLNLNHLTIDLKKALETIYNSDMKLNGKRNQSFQIYQIAFKKFKISQKTNEKRVFHSVTNLSSLIHENLYLDNTQVSYIDARQSQLVLLSLLTKDIDPDFYQEVHTKYIYDEIINYHKEKLNKESIIVGKQKNFQFFNGDEKITCYIHPNSINKKIVKPLVFASIFGGFSNRNYNPVTEYFENKFPVLVKHIRDTYDKENSLSDKLQKFEASIWVKAFNNLTKKNIISIVKHDALLFKYSNTKTVLDEVIHQYKLKGLIINRFNMNKYLDLGVINPDELFYAEPIKIVLLEDFKTEYSKQKTSLQKLNGNTDLTVQNFINKDGLTFKGIKSDFVKLYKLDKKNVNKLINGSLKTVKGWFVKN